MSESEPNVCITSSQASEETTSPNGFVSDLLIIELGQDHV
jgi:hypothetical protein